MASFKGNSSKIVSSSYLFTQLQNLYTKIKGLIDGKADKSHTHNYAGSSSAGGAATTAIACTGNSATATNADMVDGEHSSAFVHITGGAMSGEIQSTCPNNYRIVQGDYGFFIRNDSNATYFMLTNKGDPYGGWSDARPLCIDNASGNCNINGNSDTVGGYHASDFLKTSGGTLTGVITCNDVSGGMWIYGKTKIPKLLDIITPTVMDSSRYDPLIRGLNTNGDYWNFGLGANNNIGFYGFNSGTTDNRTDWGLTMNITTGKVTSTAGFIGDLAGTASGNLPLSGGTINGTLSMYGNNHIDVRHIDGSTSNGMDGNIYLNYNQPTHNVYFGNDGYGIYGNGASYNGSADKVDGFHVVLSNSRGLKPISAGTSAMTPNSSTLATGNIYLQYE